MTEDLFGFIIKSGFLDEQDKSSTRYDLLEAGLSVVSWPSHAGRVAASVVKRTVNAGTPVLKGDEWNHLRILLPAALWLALRDPATDEISTGFDQLTKRRPDFFRAVVNFCAAIRILSQRSISPAEADDAQEALAGAARALLGLGMKMRPNWHIAMHFARFIKLYGPIGTFSTWAYERHNGLLARSRYFVGGRVQMTTTASRHWLKQSMVRAIIANPAPNIALVEAAHYTDVLRRLDKETAQGTLLSESLDPRRGARDISLPRPMAQPLNLRNTDRLYDAALKYARTVVGLHIADEHDLFSPLPALPAAGHVRYPHVQFPGFRCVHTT
jgi:hypothetical protein